MKCHHDPVDKAVDEPRLNFTEGMAYLRVSRAKLQRLIYAGEIDYYRVGDRIQFDRSDLRTYLDRCRVEAAHG